MKLKLEEIKSKLDEKNFNKLIKIGNPFLIDFIVKYVKLLNPDSIFVNSDTAEIFNI